MIEVNAKSSDERSSIAVVTDATSSGFTFPLWHKYYGTQFGTENLFVITYIGAEGSFDAFALGGVERLEAAYDDDLRATAVSDYVERLLSRYKTVIRVDVDEFLVVDPHKYPNLRAYIDQSNFDYATARGFDIIQGPNDAPIDLARGVLEQRRLAVALTAMNKTSVTRRPLRWGRGFHYGTVTPALDEIYLFHLKRIDIVRQCEWARRMAGVVSPGSFEAKYYNDELTIAGNFVRRRWRCGCDEDEKALLRDAFNEEFQRAIRFNSDNGFYEGPYDIERTNVLIPTRFERLF